MKKRRKHTNNKRRHKLTTMDIKKLIAEFKKIKGAKFVSFIYENSKGEIAKHLINAGVSYGNAKEKDIETLMKLQRRRDRGYIKGRGYNRADWEQMLQRRLSGLVSPNPKNSASQSDSNVKIVPSGALRFCISTQTINVWAHEVSKSIIREGKYKKVNHGANELAKMVLNKKYNLATARFRKFNIPNFRGDIKINGDVIELE